MDSEIREALSDLTQAVGRAKGPIFTDADWARVLHAFISVCAAMREQDRRFKAKAAEAERLERERCKERNRQSLMADLDKLLGPLKGVSDD